MLMSQEEKKSLEEIKQEPYVLMDKYDEEEMLAELQGKYLKGMVYQFEQTLPDGSKRTVTGLSYTGIKECAHKFSMSTGQPIDVIDEALTDDGPTYTLKVTMRHPTIGSRIGVSVQAKKFDNGATNKFALQTAYSKAQRNAMRQILPEHSIQTFIDAAINAGDIKKVYGLTTSAFSQAGEALISSMVQTFGISREQVIDLYGQLTAGKSYSELGGLKKVQEHLTESLEAGRKQVDIEAKVIENDERRTLNTSRHESGNLYKGDDSGLIAADVPFPSAIVEAVDALKTSLAPAYEAGGKENPEDYTVDDFQMQIYEGDLVLTLREFPNSKWARYNQTFKDRRELLDGIIWCVAGDSSHWFIPKGHPSVFGTVPEPGPPVANDEVQEQIEKAPKPEKPPKKKSKKPEKSSKKEPEPTTDKEVKRTTTISTKDGNKVGEVIYYEDHTATFTPAVILNHDTPPWDSFLIERVLDGMANTDTLDYKKGVLGGSEVFSYKPFYDEEGNVEKIAFISLKSERRMREIESTLRWTIEKMLDKKS